MTRKQAYEIVKTLPGYEPLLADEMANALIKGYEMAVEESAEWVRKDHDHGYDALKFIADNAVDKYKKSMEVR